MCDDNLKMVKTLIGRNDIIEKTFGSGAPGAKTAALRADREFILKHDIFYLDNVAITPEFFGPFMARSKALLFPPQVDFHLSWEKYERYWRAPLIRMF